MFLSVVGCDDGDLVCWVAQEPHVLVGGHHILRLAKILVEEGRRSGFPISKVFRDVDELVRVSETCCTSTCVCVREREFRERV